MKDNGRAEVKRERVLELDPELAEGIAPDERAQAVQIAVAPVLTVSRRGPWRVGAASGDRRGDLGLLIVDGLVARSVMIGSRGGLELLGPGDVLRPWTDNRPDLAEVSWTVLDPLRIAWLDREFAERVAPWPQIAGAVSDRILRRARVLAFLLAVSHLVTVEERLLLLLWHFAERWGRSTTRGVVVHLPLTHELLARLVGARRPPVTTALTTLAHKGLVRRGERGTWVLLGLPPASIAELRGAISVPALS